MVWQSVLHSSIAPRRQFGPDFESRNTGIGSRHLRHRSPAVFAYSRPRRSWSSAAVTFLLMPVRGAAPHASSRCAASPRGGAEAVVAQQRVEHADGRAALHAAIELAAADVAAVAEVLHRQAM